ncbi:MAG: hypothetical protein AAF591_02270 [Verrucomicrobiota bacterium]
MSLEGEEQQQKDSSGQASSSGRPRAKGPWLSRMAIHVLTVVVGVLVYWLLGFVVDDIGSIRGPDYREIEKAHLDGALVDRDKALSNEITETKRLVEQQNRKQQLLSQSSKELQKTMDQLLELQRISLEKDLELTAEQSAAFNQSLEVFLSNQENFQSINEEIAALVEAQQDLEEEQRGVQSALDEQRRPAREEYEALSERHRWRLALLKLVVLVPLFVAGVWLVVRLRGHTYFPLVLAFTGATSLKMLVVMHEHFPERWFKYLLILVSLAAAARLLVYFIRSIVAPKRDKLLRQYRDAYEKFLCPVCEYPIRRGPMKYLYWNRRTIKKLRLPAGAGVGDGEKEERYVCPACQVELYGECGSCGKVRATLLPYCEYCGAEG